MEGTIIIIIIGIIILVCIINDLYLVENFDIPNPYQQKWIKIMTLLENNPRWNLAITFSGQYPRTFEYVFSNIVFQSINPGTIVAQYGEYGNIMIQRKDSLPGKIMGPVINAKWNRVPETDMFSINLGWETMILQYVSDTIINVNYIDIFRNSSSGVLTLSATIRTTTNTVKPFVQYTARPFVQYTSTDTDLPNMPMNGRLNDCSDACTSDPNCLGFSREKSKLDDAIAQCWLKKNMPSPTYNDARYQTYMKDGTSEISAIRATYTAKPFVQYTGPDTDLPNMPINGRLNDCSDACTLAPNCLGFSREKSKPDDAIAPCWLKKNIPNVKYNDATYQTYMKDETPGIFATTYTARPLVQYTGADTDLPNMPMNGRLNDCSNACTSAPNCLGFSREKSKPNDAIAPCWLKKNMQSPTYNDATYQTYVKDRTPEISAIRTTTYTMDPSAFNRMGSKYSGERTFNGL